MIDLNYIVVKSIDNLVTVNNNKGRRIEMKNRSSYGISFAQSGKIIYTHGNKKFVSDKQHAIILPQGQSYFLVCEQKGSFPVINFSCDVPFTDEFIVIPIDNTENYISQYAEMKRLSLNRKPGAKCMSILYSIMNQMCEDVQKRNNKLYPVIKYIERNYSDEISNASLAGEFGISEVYLRKLFKRIHNTSPYQYVINYRLSRARQALTEGTQSISDICFSCGFTNIYHFSRLFKLKTGMTPTQYRTAFTRYEL